ncbi:MAG: processing protease [Candidatus Taylorbacteria bacterium]|nr:processing protease [Candidatus Taylorbacteria bacterium]
MKFTKTTLKNGLRLVTVPMPANPAVTVLVLVEAGSKYESKAESGISHFLEHMVFKGTTKRPKASLISRELDSIGAHYNAFTGQEYTGYYAKVDKRHTALALDIVSDMYADPLLDAAEIEKEKGVIIEELRMYQDLPHRHVQDLFLELVYGDQPAGWKIVGNEGTIKSFTRDHFIDYRSRHYVAPATTVIVSGSFDEASIAGEVEKAFAKISGGPDIAKALKPKVIEAQAKPEAKVHFRETDQTHLVIGVRSFDTFSKYDPALKVLSTVLGKGMSSRLFTILRDEMGVCYYVNADNDGYTDTGLFTVSAGVDNKRVEEVLKVIMREFRRLTNEAVPAHELQKAKDFMLGSTVLGLETSDAQAEFFGMQETVKGKIRSFEEISAEIMAVTAEDLQNVAKLIFVDQGLNLALVGRYQDASALMPVLTFAAN